MKITTLLMIVGCLHISAASLSQTISIKANKWPITQVFDAIRQQTDYQVIYSDELIDLAAQVSLATNKMPLEIFLEKVLKPLSLTYQVKENTILIGSAPHSKPPTASKVLEIKPQQQRTIKGTVTDEQDSPLEGVTITVKGKPISSITDTEGSFHIAVPNDAQFLVFTMIGFDEVEREIDGQTIVDVTLKTAISDLEEVAVVAYGIQKKESVVGSISTVKPRDLKVPTRSLTNALAGNIAGVIAVQRSGEPGKDDAQFWIRGVSTFGAGANPLVLVDGVERSLSNIEPEEIESFSVLKDAAATAVYGIRGANGVVLVNTRKGQTGKPTISVKSEYGMVGATRLPKLTDAATSYKLYNEANLNVNPNFKTPYTEDIIETYELQSDPLLYPN